MPCISSSERDRSTLNFQRPMEKDGNSELAEVLCVVGKDSAAGGEEDEEGLPPTDALVGRVVGEVSARCSSSRSAWLSPLGLTSDIGFERDVFGAAQHKRTSLAVSCT